MNPSALQIVQRLRQAGHLAYFAGGCVRDLLRGVPAHDIDIATSARPEQVQALFERTVAVGAQFGVVLVRSGEQAFEVATFRADEAYVDGRRPTGVRFVAPVEDAQRRDFTINGLFYDPLSEQVLDYVGGLADLAAGLVRAIGDAHQRFGEDKLRLMRCVRFASSLGFEIEPATWSAVQELAPQITVVSAERIRDELVKILTRPQAGRGLQLLAESGLLAVILPEVAAMRGVEQPPEFHPEGDVFTHVKLMLDALPPEPSTTLALAVLLHDVGKPPTFQRADRIRFNEHDKVGAEMTETILRRLRFANDQIAAVRFCVAEHMRFRHVQEMRPAKLKRMLARPTFADELELHRLDCLSSHGSTANVTFLQEQARAIPPDRLRPKPLVTGHDLLALGIAPGPRLGQLLKQIEELQLEERLQTREQALAYAQAHR